MGESLPRRETGKRREAAFRTGIAAVLAIACAGGGAVGLAAPRHKAPPVRLARLVPEGRVSVETLIFHGQSVRIVRGGARLTAPRPRPVLGPAPRLAAIEHRQVVSFGAAGRVTIVRGRGVATAPFREDPHRSVETVRFADSRLPPVTIVRAWGAEPARPASPPPLYADLFGPANGDELDRIAFAVDGLESRHGADLAMWRPEIDGPQGPMQVSAAAAFDVGGGDRFDLEQNRLLGRAYLAQMFRRYGNWPDALAAYNWGPANVDKWIVGGRDPYQMPPGVAWYVTRALHDAVITTAAALAPAPTPVGTGW